jgi:hypothetical protein
MLLPLVSGSGATIQRETAVLEDATSLPHAGSPPSRLLRSSTARVPAGILMEASYDIDRRPPHPPQQMRAQTAGRRTKLVLAPIAWR